MTRRGLPTVLIAALAALLMTAASLLALALLGPPAAVTGAAPACSAPSLPGTTVRVTEADMGAGMMGRSAMRRGMRLSVDRASVPHGQVSLVATNLGSVPHELLVVPLPQGQTLGARAVGADGTVDETGSLGEASASCAAGTGEGIAPGAASWVTLTLPAGHYELLCNLPGRYLAGMFAELTVT
ncbi:sulfocyanin-like copper-binding protein [Sinomonas sp. RB5]